MLGTMTCNRNRRTARVKGGRHLAHSGTVDSGAAVRPAARARTITSPLFIFIYLPFIQGPGPPFRTFLSSSRNRARYKYCERLCGLTEFIVPQHSWCCRDDGPPCHIPCILFFLSCGCADIIRRPLVSLLFIVDFLYLIQLARLKEVPENPYRCWLAKKHRFSSGGCRGQQDMSQHVEHLNTTDAKAKNAVLQGINGVSFVGKLKPD